MGTQMAPHATSHRAAELKEMKTIRVMPRAEATLRLPADAPVPENEESAEVVPISDFPADNTA